MSARIVILVRWSKAEKLWTIKRRDISGGVLAYARTRAEAIKKGRAEVRAHAAGGGKAELVIYRKDNAIGKGHGSRSTHPRSSDPRRRKG